MIKIICGKTEVEASLAAANVMADVVKVKPNAVLGLATGSSPINMYKELARMCKAGEISFKNVKSVNLDEYVGLSPDHDQSYAYFMNENLFRHIDIDKANTNLPSGLASDPAAECIRYDAVIESMGGVDIQLLGIGNNGHIGFNEPDTYFPKTTSLVELTDSTIDANSRFFASRDLVPTKAISMGIGQIIKFNINRRRAVCFEKNILTLNPLCNQHKHIFSIRYCPNITSEIIKKNVALGVGKC